MKSVFTKVSEFFVDGQHRENRQTIAQSSRDCYCTEFIADAGVQLPMYKGDVDLGTDVMNDIEMFRAYKEDDETIYNTIFKCNSHLNGTEIFVKHILSNPTTSISTLMKRQETIKTMESDIQNLNKALASVANMENDILWIFENREENVKALYDIVYFKMWFLKRLNGVDSALTTRNIYRIILSPVIGVLSPLFYFIVPYVVIRYRFRNFPLSFKSYLKVLLESSSLMFQMKGISGNLKYCSYLFSMIFYFQGVFNSVEIAKTLYKISDFIIQKTSHIIQFVNEANFIVSKWFVPDSDDVFFGVHLQKFENVKVPPVSNSKLWIFKNFGKYLKVFHRIEKNDMSKLLSRIYVIDSIATIINAVQKNGFCYPRYSQYKSPTLMTNNIRHPCIVNAVGNDIFIGNEKYSRNVILTGPNAGGKSTFVKSIIINVVLCQTVAVSCSDACTMTPFKFINSQINIPDCKGKESLFQAEMNRCKMNFDRIKKLGKTEYALVIMDEIFNSTNPVEGISGAYAVASKLTQNTSVTMIFTTHFTYLTRLAKKTGAFTNYRMNVEATETGTYVFPYKLSKGISRQYIALELLEMNGFDKDIIDEAKSIRNKICV